MDADLPSFREHRCLEELVAGDLARLPFPEACFDLVLCSWIMEHLATPDAVFAELARVLQTRRPFGAAAPNAWNYLTMVQRLIPGRSSGA